MLQKMIIEVETSKPLTSYGEGHVIVYNAQRKCYYVTTRDNLLAPQNAKIRELEKIVDDAEKQIERTKANIEETVQTLLATFADFKTTTTSEFNGTITRNNTNFGNTVDTLTNVFAQSQTENRKEMNAFQTELYAQMDAFKKEIEAKQSEFYATYKETNAKILDLVKKTCITTETTAEAEGE